MRATTTRCRFLGATNTGFIIPVGYTPLPQLSPLPTVNIGGVDASAGVSYAGPVPGSILGVLQINVVVPLGSATGQAVPVSGYHRRGQRASERHSKHSPVGAQSLRHAGCHRHLRWLIRLIKRSLVESRSRMLN